MTHLYHGWRSPLIAHLHCFIDLTESETAALASLETPSHLLGHGRLLQEEGQPFTAGYILNDGWAMRHKDLSDGRRQVLDFVLPGDFVGLEGTVVRSADHTVTALTDVRISRFAFDHLEHIIHDHPRLVTAMVWLAVRQRTVLAEHLLSLGRRSARERVAHVLLEIWRRLYVRGLGADHHCFHMPITQTVLADALGLSTVHINRCLSQLAKAGLVEKRRDTVSIIDLPGLKRAADFESGYLSEVPVAAGMSRTYESPR